MKVTVSGADAVSGNEQSQDRLLYRPSRDSDPRDVPIVVHRVMTAIDEFTDPSVNGHMVPMVLTPGEMRAEVVSAAWRAVAVEDLDYSFSMATRGESRAQRIGFVAPIRRTGVGHMNGQTMAPGAVLHVFGEAAEVAGSSAGAAEFATFSYSPDALEDAARGLGIEVDLPGRGEFRSVRAVSWPILRSLVHDLKQSVRESGKVALECARGRRRLARADRSRRARLCS